MDKEKLDIQLLDYWQGETLSKEEKAEVLLWLEESEEHRQYYETLKRDYLRQRWAMRERLIGRKDERRYRKMAKKRKMIRVITTFAASVLLALGVGYYGSRPQPEPVPVIAKGEIKAGSAKAKLYLSTGKTVELERENMDIFEQQDVSIKVNTGGIIAYQDTSASGAMSTVAYNRLAVNKGGEYKIVLSDSSEVWVNSASELVYPIRFVGKKRVVKLQGEAYFKVRADAERPFAVEVNGVEVTAVGTEFNVNTRKKNKVESVLVEGKINIRKGQTRAMLRPNQLAIYDAESGQIEVKDVDVRKYIDWKSGDFIFSDDRLEDVMDKLSLWYDCEVFYLDAKLKEVRLSGDMKRYGQVEEFLRFLEISTGAKFEVRGKAIFVSAK